MKLHLSRDADFSIENYYAKQERVTLTGVVIFTSVCLEVYPSTSPLVQSLVNITAD